MLSWCLPQEKDRVVAQNCGVDALREIGYMHCIRAECPMYASESLIYFALSRGTWHEVDFFANSRDCRNFEGFELSIGLPMRALSGVCLPSVFMYALRYIFRAEWRCLQASPDFTSCFSRGSWLEVDSSLILVIVELRGRWTLDWLADASLKWVLPSNYFMPFDWTCQFKH